MVSFEVVFIRLKESGRSKEGVVSFEVIFILLACLRVRAPPGGVSHVKTRTRRRSDRRRVWIVARNTDRCARVQQACVPAPRHAHTHTRRQRQRDVGKGWRQTPRPWCRQPQPRLPGRLRLRSGQGCQRHQFGRRPGERKRWRQRAWRGWWGRRCGRCGRGACTLGHHGRAAGDPARQRDLQLPVAPGPGGAEKPVPDATEGEMHGPRGAVGGRQNNHRVPRTWRLSPGQRRGAPCTRRGPFNFTPMGVNSTSPARLRVRPMERIRTCR